MPSFNRWIFSFLLSVTLPCAGYAQIIRVPATELITEEEGLPFNAISDIVQDARGFLWVFGRAGVARYDGYSFLKVPRDQWPLITSATIDKSGMLWIGCANGELYRMNPRTLKINQFKIQIEKNRSLTSSLFCDSKGNLWVYIESTGLYKFDGTSSFTFIGSLPNLPQQGLAAPEFYNKVGYIYEASPDTFWLSTSNGIYRFNPLTHELVHASPLTNDPDRPAFLHHIEPDNRGGLWCSTYGMGLIHFDPATGKFQSYLYEQGFQGTANIIYSLRRKSDHELWISCGGVGVFDERTKTFSFSYDKDDIDIGMSSYKMIEGKEGMLWLVTDKGLLKLIPGDGNFGFNRVKVSRSDNHSYYGISDVLEDVATGRTIVGTQFADGLHVYDSLGRKTTLGFYCHPEGEPYLIVNDLMRTREGEIMVVTRSKLYTLTRQNTLVPIEDPNRLLPPSVPGYFNRILEDVNGDWWMASSRNGLLHYSKAKKKWTIHRADAGGLASNRVFRIEVDALGKIWAAHPLDGISIYDPEHNTWDYIKYEKGNPDGLISNLFTDFARSPRGYLLFATLEGISVIDPITRKITHLSEASGLPSHSIYSVVCDDRNNIWAASDKGVFVLDETGKLIRHFTTHHGIRGIYSNLMFRKSSHKIQIGYFGGYYEFDPERVLSSGVSHAPVYITGVNNRFAQATNFLVPEEVVLKYDANALTVEFASLNYAGRNNNRYRYKMDGLDNNWTVTSANYINYSGIPPGDYTFRVQNLTDPDREATLSVSVTAPFWKQLWFRISTVLLILGVLYLIYRSRVRAIRQEEKLKAEFNKKLAEVEMKALKAQMNPHFIFNSLNSINRYIIKAEPEMASMYLTKFSKLIRLILDNSNSRIISLEQELVALKLYIELEALRFNNKFTYAINIDPELNPNSIGVPPMIIQPFVENAIWHGLLHKETEGRLTVTFSRYAHGLQCVVEDNGIGREKAGELKSKSVDKEKSHGLKITSDRLTMLNGDNRVSSVEIIDLVDHAGQAVGTKVVVRIMVADIEPEF
jgi:ligand-binding sensor domain-containing protein